MVLRKEPRGAKIVSRKYFMPDIRCLPLDNIGEHRTLKPRLLEYGVTPINPRLDEVVVLSSDEVVVVLYTNEHEPSYKDKDEVGHKEDDLALID